MKTFPGHSIRPLRPAPLQCHLWLYFNSWLPGFPVRTHTETDTHTHATPALSFNRLSRLLVRGSTMSERRGNWPKTEDDLPVYLARPGTADQVPRQKHGGLFCSVEDAFESKTIDFDALSVGQRGSRTPRTSKRESGQEARNPASDNKRSSPGEKSQEKLEIRTSGGKEVLQNLGEEKVRSLYLFICFVVTTALK